MNNEPDELMSFVRTGERIWLLGPSNHQTMRLVPRKWWQFWKPHMVEEWRSWEDGPPMT